MSTLHTINAGETVNRILGMFEPEEQEQIRIRLADSLRWVVSQRLCPKIGGGRCALMEIMGSNLRTQEAIRLGESEGKTFYEIIEASYPFGWRHFDHACLEAYEQGLITEENALLYCTKRSVVSRGIDNFKKVARRESPPMSAPCGCDPAASGIRQQNPARAERLRPLHLETSINRMSQTFDFVSTEDKPALIAFSTPEWLQEAKTALQELGYKVHTAATHSDFLMRFSQAHYQVVILEELFGANTPEENLTLQALQNMPVNQRRHATIVLHRQFLPDLHSHGGVSAQRPCRHQQLGNVPAQTTRGKSRGRQPDVFAELSGCPSPHFPRRSAHLKAGAVTRRCLPG